MLASTLFVRVVPADKDRGYVLLAGYDAGVVQRTALQYTTLSTPTRDALNAAIERMRASNNAKDVKDVTAPNIQKKLAKLFGETATPSAPTTFSGLGIGSYLK
jgi:hypothetical protein